ncbi:hypothetical protein ABZV75_18540 [Streptomyces flaveolus]|uniref:hypothetical protein n=1 Tax=Streptomyces flaveolus TaxID=67297 RepID=UPI0033AD05B5
MPHRMLRSAAIVLLASAPLTAAAPAQAASRAGFPCAVGLQKIDSAQTSTVTLSIQCGEARTAGVRLTAGSAELLNLRETLQAHVRQAVTVTVPRVPQVCAALQADDQTATVCTP